MIVWSKAKRQTVSESTKILRTQNKKLYTNQAFNSCLSVITQTKFKFYKSGQNLPISSVSFALLSFFFFLNLLIMRFRFFWERSRDEITIELDL